MLSPEISLLEAACIYGATRVLVRRMLETSKVLTDEFLGTRLFECVGRRDRMDLAQLLLDIGLSLDFRSSKGQTPLMLATKYSNTDMFTWLLDQGSNVNATDQGGMNVAHYVCVSGDLKFVRLLRIIDVDWQGTAKTKIGKFMCGNVTPLHLAAYHAKTVFLKFLIDENLVQELDCVTSLNETPLHLAVIARNIPNVKLLLSKNVSMEVHASGQLPLHLAVILGDLHIYSLFSAHECDPRTPNDEELDYEMIAMKYGHTELATRISSDKGKRLYP